MEDMNNNANYNISIADAHMLSQLANPETGETYLSQQDAAAYFEMRASQIRTEIAKFRQQTAEPSIRMDGWTRK
jgi:hypothetical protein